MFIQKLYTTFFIIVTISSLALLYSWYSNYNFKKQDLSLEIQHAIQTKKEQVRSLVLTHYGFDLNIPIIIKDELPNKLFGAASYTTQNQIIIYLNKNHFKESLNYMIQSVIPHEYAHAVMFYLKDFSTQNSGHSKKWQTICETLSQKPCDRYANQHDILIEKTSF
jgi:hypothetical protein